MPEPFFVKNLERVQGDERDAIILSIGYGKHPDGRMRYQWGPLLRDGGERRLNVAATRAKHRLTVVSSFSSHDVDPERLTKAGARLLAEYLEYAGAGGTPMAAAGAGAADAFEASVRSRLAGYGIIVVPQYGVGGYRVDFAAAHPDDPSRMILAVEADGASYRDSGSVRDRDRLRKEHLERLGWNVHRLWSTNWLHDPDAEVAKLREAYDRAVASAPRSQPPEPPEPPEPYEPVRASPSRTSRRSPSRPPGPEARRDPRAAGTHRAAHNDWSRAGSPGTAPGSRAIPAARGRASRVGRHEAVRDASHPVTGRGWPLYPGKDNWPATEATPMTANHRALLVIDMQNAFCHPDGSFAQMDMGLEGALEAVANAAVAVGQARRAGIAVVFTRHVYRPGRADEGQALKRNSPALASLAGPGRHVLGRPGDGRTRLRA